MSSVIFPLLLAVLCGLVLCDQTSQSISEKSIISDSNEIDNLVDVTEDDLIDPDVFRDTLELIASRGFEAEEHKVITEDGYMITLHRIINPFIPRNVSNRKPVLCVHGLMDTSASFVMNSAGGFARPLINNASFTNQSVVGNNLGFELSNHGYDVWLGNPRGSLYNHNERASGSGSGFGNSPSMKWQSMTFLPSFKRFRMKRDPKLLDTLDTHKERE